MVEEQKTKLKPVLDRMELIVDSTGGTLHLKDEGIKLQIQPGAIEEGKTVKISLENILEETDMPVLHPLESIISPIVKCGPEGTIFNKPCLLSFPHNAVNEEFWEFSLLFKECFQDKWKNLTLEIDEKDMNFTLNKGRCFINLNHFCFSAIKGRVRNIFYAKKSIKLGVFGKALVNENEYRLRVTFFKPGKQKEVNEEQAYQGDKLLEPGTVRSLYKDLEIRVEIPNQKWRVVDKRVKIILAEYLWCERPSTKFYLERVNSSTNDLRATLSLKQDSNDIPEVEVDCDIRSSIARNVEPPVTNPANFNVLQEKFRKLKHDLGLVYVGERYLLPRCCLFDEIDLETLADPNCTANDLFNNLHDKDDISPADINILSEIADLSQLKDAENLINLYVIENKISKTDKHTLSTYRKRLCKALKQFDPNKLKDVIAFYGLRPLRNSIETIWDLVFHLESNGKLINESERKIFADLLGPIAKNILDPYQQQHNNDSSFIKRIYTYLKDHWWMIPVCIILIAVFVKFVYGLV
ncbi:UNC5C-like protein [Antedon mediterranea]|uniref:UNC5C-like protein n=1 Tax=Antedon mediterranea TaxID=105859 RepID=UPI003AF4B011